MTDQTFEGHTTKGYTMTEIPSGLSILLSQRERDAAEIARLRAALVRIVQNFVWDGEVFDEPNRGFEMSWREAVTALALKPSEGEDA